MISIRTILYPTDFSEQSEFAFRVACSLARDYGARLIILHVAESPMIFAGEGFVVLPCAAEGLRERLSQLRPLDPKVEVEHRLSEGDPATEILEVDEETRWDVIVLSTHGL